MLLENRYGRERCRSHSMTSLARGDVAAAAAAQRLAERAGQDVDAGGDAAVLGRAAPVRAHEAGGVRVIHHDERVVALGEIADARAGWR